MIYHIDISDLELEYLQMRYLNNELFYTCCRKLGLSQTELNCMERHILERIALACPVKDKPCIDQVLSYLHDYIYNVEVNENDNESLFDSRLPDWLPIPDDRAE